MNPVPARPPVDGLPETVPSRMVNEFVYCPRLFYLAVFDGAHSEPVPRPAYSPEATGGRGLHLVDIVTTRWGFLRRTDGKVVWAALTT